MFSNTKNTLVVISLLCVSAATAFGQGIVKQGAKNLTKQVLKNNSKAAVVQKQIGKHVQMALLKKAGAASKLDKSQLSFTPLQVNGQLYYVAENGVKLKTQTDVSAFTFAAENGYYDVLIKDDSVHGFYPVKGVFLNNLWDAKDYVSAIEAGFKVKVENGKIAGVSPVKGVWLNNFSLAETYQTAQRAGLNPLAENGKITGYEVQKGVKLSSIVYAQDFAQAKKLGFAIRVQKGKTTGFSPVRDMWFYHLADAKVYAQARALSALQKVEGGVLTIMAPTPVHFRFDPKYDAYFLFDPDLARQQQPPFFNWPGL